MTRLHALRCVLLPLAVVACGLAAPATASAAPLAAAVTVAATATGPTSGAASDTRATVTVTITVADAPAATTVLSAPVPGVVDAAAVKVDGAAAPTGTVSTASATGPSRTEVTVRLGVGANAVTGGILGIGTYTVTIPIDLAGRSGTSIAAFATTIGFVDAGGNRSVSSDVTVPLPDLLVSSPVGSGQDGVLPLAPDDLAIFYARIETRSGPLSAATLVITIPTTLQIEPSFGVIRGIGDSKGGALTCTRSANKVTCPLGAVDQPQFIAIPLTRTRAAMDGKTATLTVSAIAANGLDATPDNNVVSGTVRFVPPTMLRVALSAERTRVEVGSTTKITATVSNVGTAPAADVIGVLVSGIATLDPASSSPFRIKGFTGRTGDLFGNGGSGGGSTPATSRAPREMQQVAASLAQRASATKIRFEVVPWSVGTLSAGATRTAVLTLKAVSPGEGKVAVFAASLDSISGCLIASNNPRSCPEYAEVTLRAVAAAGTNGAGADPIAATGVPTERWAGFALLLLLLGAAAQLAGARPTSIGRHRIP